MSGKGSSPRPFSVDQRTFSDNWDRIFKDTRAKEDAQAKDESFDLVQQRIAREKQSLNRMRDHRDAAQKQEEAWLQNEYYDIDTDTQCWCFKCNKHRVISKYGELAITYPMTRMILCPSCGNKRCPRATDHALDCTNSNEPGQPGSRY